MDLMSFLHFSFGYCVTVLAWPLLALVYPICASIRAIETNSFSDSQTLNAYWVVLSLMLLLEHGFMKLFGWPFSWQYIRITIICFLVIPYFDGASYVYKCFIHPLIFSGIQIIINWFQTHKESQLPRESFLDELDKYVKVYGTEAVERILTDKSNKREPKVLHKDIKAVEVTKKNEVMEIYQDQSNTREPEVLHKNIKAVEVTEKNEVMEIYQDQSNTREPEVLHKNIKAVEVTEKNEVMEIYQDQFYSKEPDVLHEDNKALEVTEKNEVMTIDQDQVSQIEPSFIKAKISCDVIHETQKETTLNPCQSRRHRRETKWASSDIQKAESGTMPIIENVQVLLKSVPPNSSATNSNKLKEETAKAPLSSEMEQEISTKEKIEKQHKKIPNKQTVEVKAPSLWCDLCKISCPCVIVMESHLKGRKHQARIQLTTAM